eukprot:5972244-Amphidinium_carterae.2
MARHTPVLQVSSRPEKGRSPRLLKLRSPTGEWFKGLRDGQGVHSWPDGASYDGQWQQDRALKDVS